MIGLTEIARYLRMGTQVPEGELAARVEKLLAVASPAFAPRRVFRRESRSVLPFASRHLDRNLAGCRDVYLLGATLGAEFDALLRRVGAVSGVDVFVMQAIGAAAIERYVDDCEDEIRQELAEGETLAKRYSPGYGDFPLAANRLLVERLDATRRIGVSLTDTLLLVPSKTVTAVIGVVEGGEPTGRRIDEA